MRTRLGLVGRLALTMGAIAVAAVAISLALVYQALDGRLNGLAQAHVQSSAERAAALAARDNRSSGW
jgi:ABC-type Co2+ transport system permease subunit